MKRRRLPLNDENTLLVVTSFPPPSHKASEGKQTQGISPISLHAQKTLTELSEKQNILVLAERLGKKKTHIETKQLTVYRVWKQKRPLSLLKIVPYLFRFNKIRNVLFQFDFNVFGGLKPTLIVPSLIILMRLLGKHVYFELQHIPNDIRVLKRHALSKSKVKGQKSKLQLKIQNFLHNLFLRSLDEYLKLFYKTVGYLCDKIIIFEEDMKDRLTGHIDEEKLVVLPVGITEQKPLSKSKSKRSLGFSSRDFVVLVFGFFDWHKGTDWITKVFSDMNTKNMKLLLVGGKNPALKDNKNYQSYCNEIIKMAHASTRTKIIGFVPDHKITKYYSAADVVALPYREFMAAPTTLTHALSFHKPVIFSTNLIEYMKSPDFFYAMDQTHTSDQDLFFSIDKNDVEELLKRIKTDKQLYKKLSAFSARLAKQRRSNRLKRDYQNIVSRSYALTPRFAFNVK